MTGTSSELPSPLGGTGWLEQHLGEPGLRILDCTVLMKPAPDGGNTFVGGREEWEKSHIPGAVFVDVLADLSDRNNPLPMMMPPAEEFARIMSALGVGEGTRVVVYDRANHAWAARVWWMLRCFGFDAAAVLDGGWQKWIAEGRRVSSSPGKYPKADFQPRYRPGRVAAKEELRRRFEPTGANGISRVVTYCGGGIAASSDALVLTLLGIENVAVYDGSLAEWAADPSLPMEADQAAR